VYCQGCGSQIASGTRFCAVCGRPVATVPPPPAASPDHDRRTLGLVIVAVPFPLVAEACDHRSLGPADEYVRILSTTVGRSLTIEC